MDNEQKKFIDDKIITSVGGKLTLINFEGEIVKEYSEINSNWLSLINKERVIIYGNFNNEIGIVKLNKDFNIEYHHIIMKTDNRKLFEYAIQTFNDKKFIINNISLDLYGDQYENNIPTEYELKFQQLGVPIYMIDVQK